jgi:hypothetical protein
VSLDDVCPACGRDATVEVADGVYACDDHADLVGADGDA